MNELSQVLSALHGSGAKYIVVGGVAVMLHGHPRFTIDVAALAAPRGDGE